MNMRILLTNDDGYKSRTLNILAKTLFEFGHEPIVFSPVNDVSGQGSALNLHPEAKIDIKSKDDIKIYAVHGTTTDCVIFGTAYYNNIDLVISGINYGLNVGRDTLNSATVSGAKEAIMRGIPAMALSINSYNPRNIVDITKYFCELLDRKLQSILSNKYLLNINFPDRPVNKIGGLKVVPMSRKGWNKDITFEEKGRELTVRIKATRPKLEGEKGTDLYWVTKGYITITPVVPDLIDYNLIHQLEVQLQLD